VALNSLGFEVEHEINYKELNKGLIIGYIQECLIIPNTHLSVNQVKISKTKTIQIVCGAPNVMTGQYVLVAPLGATIADGTIMTKRTLQGYESNGMICSLAELGFTNAQLTADEQKEIYVVKNEPNLSGLIGKSINEIGFDDYV
jgi:phenylalanyl-tRNA synthetase beta chain